MRVMFFLYTFLIGQSLCQAQNVAAWKPDTADLLFASTRDGNSEVYLSRAGQNELVNLSNNKSSDNWPVWSPDGRKIAFQSNRTGNLDIWVMNDDGTNQVQLTNNPEPDYIPCWSPDGTSILFTSWRKEENEELRAPHIYAMNTDGSHQRRLVKESLNTSDGATCSADGKLIVYTRKGEKGADLYIADSDGTNERRITFDQDSNIYNGSATFSPDGQYVAFYSDNEKSAALSVMGIDGKNRKTILADGYNWYPRWSPDSRWLVYTAKVPSEDNKNIDLFAIPIESNVKPTLLVGGPAREVEGSWRPK